MLPHTTHRCIPLAAILIAAQPSIAQNVLVVEDPFFGDPTSFPTVQAAVDAAAPGDTILVRNVRREPIRIDKGISLIAERPRFLLTQPMTIENVPAGQTVLVTGFWLNHYSSLESTMQVTNCIGEVWIQDCTIDVPNGFFQGVSVTNSRSVTFLRTTVEALYDGVDIFGSIVQAFDCSFTGAASVPTSLAAGVSAEDSFVYLQGVTAIGGIGQPQPLACSTSGGPGLHAVGASVVVAVDCTFLGGPPFPDFFPQFCPVPTAVQGPPTVIEPTASLTTQPGPALRMSAPYLAREGQAVEFSIDADAGDQLVLAISRNADSLDVPLLNAPLLVGANFVGAAIGTAPSSGAVTVPTIAPTFFPGVLLERYFVQLLALRIDGTLLGGPAQAITVLDTQF